MLRDDAGKAFDPAIVARFTELLPVLTPPANDGVARRTPGTERAGDPAAAERGERISADAFAEIASANRETNALYEIAQSMGRSMSLADTMAFVSEKLGALVPLSMCALFVRRGDEDLRCRFVTGLHADRLNKMHRLPRAMD